MSGHFRGDPIPVQTIGHVDIISGENLLAVNLMYRAIKLALAHSSKFFYDFPAIYPLLPLV